MQIILSKLCESISGSLNRKLGYHIEHRKNVFFSKRDSHKCVPPDGHWRFILLCAQEAQTGFLFEDIIVPPEELREALDEAGHTDVIIFPATYYAESILELKQLWDL